MKKQRFINLCNTCLIGLLFLFPIPFGAMAKENSTESGLKNSLREQIDVSALIETEWAGGIGEEKNQKFELLFLPELEIDLPRGIALTAIGRLRGDIFDKLEPFAPPQSEVSHFSRRLTLGDHVDVELRELYIEATLGRTFLTIGKQQIVWGQADGLKVLDVVNPQDFREFILDDFSDSRIPLWAMNAEIPIGGITAQLIFLPDRTYHEFPESDSIYAFTSPMLRPTPPPGIAVDLRPVERPRRFFTDSDIGARLSTFLKGWDLTVNYFYHYNDFPVLFRELSMTPGGPLATVTPRYERTQLAGGTFSNAFGNLTVRGEVGFSFDRFFSTDDPTDADGVVKTNELAYVLGLDWNGISETLVIFQFFQNWLTDNKERILRDQVDTNVSLLLQREFLNDSLVVGMLGLQNINHGDGLWRPKVSYELLDNVKVWMGIDFFYGDKEGLFGQFDGNDRLVLGIEGGF